MRRTPTIVFALLVLWSAAAGRAQETPAPAPASDTENKTVALPPFLVEETGKGPPWRYAELPGFEFLSRCGDTTTRDLAQSYFQLHRLLAVVLPAELQFKVSVPHAVILYDEELQPSASREVVAQMLHREEAKNPPPVDEPLFPGRGLRLTSSRRVSFLPNIRLTDKDAALVFSIVRPDSLDTDTLYLTHDYIAYLLKNRVPALPVWFIAGFLSVYDDMTFRTGEITLKSLTWPADTKQGVVIATTPVTLKDLFSGAVAPTDAADPQFAKRWTAQAALFLRWGLDEKNPLRRAALAKFVARAGRESATERVFVECFGLDFATAQLQLAAFLPVAVRQSMHYALEGDAAKPPEVKLRDASPADIARLKGDMERLEIAYVKTNFPEAAPKYLEQARRTLLHAYERDERDPRLLAVLGLCEVDAGDDARAREFLEAAAARGSELRPRAEFELGRLRLAEALAHPAGADGKLSVSQMAEVLAPLFAARKQPPPLPEVYELIAEAWAHSVYPATRAHLAVLDEGVALFPRRTELVYRAAALNTTRGFFADAEPLIDLGLRVATDDPTRERFTMLKSQLTLPTP